MRAKVASTGTTIRQHLIESEDSIDRGLIANSLLAATLLNARLDLGLRAQAKRELVAEAGAILTDMFAHRERILSMHERLGALAAEIGLPTTAFGDSGDKSGISPVEPQVSNVHSIAA